MNLKIVSLGSGSSGNAILIIADEYGVLIDAGFTKKEILRRLELCSISPKEIKALLISHEHGDHVKGARIFADQLGIVTYASTLTANYLLTRNEISRNVVSFVSGSTFKINKYLIQTLQVSHDAIDPSGFIVSIENFRIGYAMDIGHLDKKTALKLKGCDILITEANYDEELLRESKRPISLKKRIQSNVGHLSNKQSIESFNALIAENTKYVLLGHISAECNCYEKISKMVEHKLIELNRKDIHVSLLKHNEPILIDIKI